MRLRGTTSRSQSEGSAGRWSIGALISDQNLMCPIQFQLLFYDEKQHKISRRLSHILQQSRAPNTVRRALSPIQGRQHSPLAPAVLRNIVSLRHPPLCYTINKVRGIWVYFTIYHTILPLPLSHLPVQWGWSETAAAPQTESCGRAPPPPPPRAAESDPPPPPSPHKKIFPLPLSPRPGLWGWRVTAAAPQTDRCAPPPPPVWRSSCSGTAETGLTPS
jgi:hypothetical protein